jgi:hypothetical protein
MDFYAKAFGAKDRRVTRPPGVVIPGEIRIGDAVMRQEVP